MITIKQAVQEAKKMNKKLKPIMKVWGAEAEGTIESEILGMHESATKLWVATMGKKGQAEINRRVASALIGVMIVAYRLGVKDLEKEFRKRIEEVIGGNKKAAGEMKRKK